MKRWVKICLFLLLVAAVVPAYAEPSGVVIYDEKEEEIFSIRGPLDRGDRLLNEDNVLFELKEVVDHRAQARRIQKLRLPPVSYTTHIPAPKENLGAVGLYATGIERDYRIDNEEERNDGFQELTAVISTHLERKGVEVKSSVASHLVENEIDALLAIDRDFAPRSQYTTEIEGEATARITLVIERSNPDYASNEKFAKQLKAAADELYPGLIRGIYYGRHSLNQDLHPRALLLLIGSDETTFDEAKRGAELMAGLLAGILYREPTRGTGEVEGMTPLEDDLFSRNTAELLVAVIAALFGGVFVFRYLQRKDP